jgi:hypothetical protein
VRPPHENVLRQGRCSDSSCLATVHGFGFLGFGLWASGARPTGLDRPHVTRAQSRVPGPESRVPSPVSVSS